MHVYATFGKHNEQELLFPEQNRPKPYITIRNSYTQHDVFF